MAISKKRTLIIAAALTLGAGLTGVVTIFAFLAPVMTYPISVDLPQRAINPSSQRVEAPPPIDLRVDSSNQLFWNSSPVTVGELQQWMEEEVQKDPTNQPELRIDTNPDSGYEVMAKILAAAKNADIKKIGFTQ